MAESAVAGPTSASSSRSKPTLTATPLQSPFTLPLSCPILLTTELRNRKKSKPKLLKIAKSYLSLPKLTLHNLRSLPRPRNYRSLFHCLALHRQLRNSGTERKVSLIFKCNLTLPTCSLSKLTAMPPQSPFTLPSSCPTSPTTELRNRKKSKFNI